MYQKDAMVNKNSVSLGLKNFYQAYLDIDQHKFDEKHYAELCKQELKELSKRGLHEIFNNSVINLL